MKHGKRDEKTEAQKQIDKAKRDSLRAEFLTQWRRLGGPELAEEFKFHTERDWRVDFYHPSGVVIEIEGGTHVNGRHNRAEGYTKDCIKYNALNLMGFRLFRFTTDMLTNDPAGHLLPVIELMRDTADV